jgi:multisubunit Na+/H+ antiporter MnhC subunit
MDTPSRDPKTALILTALVVGVGAPYFVFRRSDTSDLDER